MPESFFDPNHQWMQICKFIQKELPFIQHIYAHYAFTKDMWYVTCLLKDGTNLINYVSPEALVNSESETIHNLFDRIQDDVQKYEAIHKNKMEQIKQQIQGQWNESFETKVANLNALNEYYGMSHLTKEQMQKLHEETIKNLHWNAEVPAYHYSSPSYHHKQSGKSTESVPGALRRVLPGIHSLVRYPCDCCRDTYKDKGFILQNVIIHLNDKAKWTREQIADWLESLDVDLEFKVPEEEIVK